MMKLHTNNVHNHSFICKSSPCLRKVHYMGIIVMCITIIGIVLTGLTLIHSNEAFAKGCISMSYRLSYTSKKMENGELYNISLKGVSCSVKADKIKWKSSNKKVVSIYSKKNNRAVLSANSTGNARISATYKGKKYICKVRVLNESEEDVEAADDNPVLNTDHVELHYLPEYAVPILGRNPEYNYSFRFKVTGTKSEVKNWSVEGDEFATTYFSIDDTGNVYMKYGSADYHKEYLECTVKAVLSSGKVLMADVRGYTDSCIYVRNKIEQFKQEYITDNMTEYEKMDKVAWYLSAEYDYELYQSDWIRYIITGQGDCMASRYGVMFYCKELGLTAAACPNFDCHGMTIVKADGKVYIVTTGSKGSKPREYMINEISGVVLERLCDKNYIDLNCFL